MPHKLLVDAPHALSDADLIAAQDLLTTLDVEMLPQDPRLPPDALVSLMRAQPSHTSLRLIRVVDDSGDVVAAAQCRMSMLSNGDRTLGVGGGVHPDHRKSGLAWTLLRAAVDVAQQADRSLLAFTTVDTVPAGEAWAQRVGAARAQVTVTNRLDLRATDRKMLEQWVADGPARAPDYELVVVEQAEAAQMLPVLCDVMTVLNDAPRDNLERADITLTPAQLADELRAATEVGAQLRWLLARHRATGEYVGLHDIHLFPFASATAFVGQTGVQAAHRGQALGKWMKAAMTLWLLDEHPEIVDVRTSNAVSNGAMLAINTAMGYRAYVRSTTWQLEVVAAARLLSR